MSRSWVLGCGVALALAVGLAGCGLARAPHQPVTLYLVAQPPTVAEAAKTPLGDLTLQAAPLVADEDVLWYDPDTHTLGLSAAALVRIEALRPPTHGLPLVLCVGAERLYLAALWPMYSSQSYEGVCVWWPPQADGSLTMRLGYPGPGFFLGPDPRADARLLRALRRSGRLGRAA